MLKHLRLLAIATAAAVIGGVIGGIAILKAAQTNYLGTVFIADTTTPTQQLKVNADGSINVDAAITPSPTVGATYGSTAALGSNLVLKASAGTLYDFVVSADSTLSAAAWWIMVYDATAAPADGAVTPAKCYAMPSGTTSASYAFPTPTKMLTGITVAVSTTGCFTKTASAHAFISGGFQ